MLITSQNARELQEKAVQARIRNQQLREQAQCGSPQFTGGYPPMVSSFSITRARTIEGLIDKLIKQIASTDDAKEQQARAVALDRLFGTYAYMTGLERPGVSKPRKAKHTETLSDLAEMPVDQ